MKKALSLIFALAMILALTACGSKTDAPSGNDDTQTDTPAEKIVLKIGHVEAEDRSTHKALLIFKDEIESKTDGRIEVQIFPNAELGARRAVRICRNGYHSDGSALHFRSDGLQ